MADRSQAESRYRKLAYIVALGSVLLVGLVVGVSNPASVTAYFCYLLVVILLYRWLAGSNLVEALLLYALYSLLILACYELQLVTSPEYNGPAGNTNDVLRYFYATRNWPQTNYGFYALYSAPLGHLQGVRFLSWFTVTHALDILFFNIVPLVLLPRFSYQLANQIQRDPAISRRAFLLVMLCPLLLASSLTLAPNGWMAMAFSGALLFWLRNEYLKLGVAVVFLFLINIGVAIVAVLVLGIFGLLDFCQQRIGRKKGVVIFSVFILAAVVAMVLAPIIFPQLNDSWRGGGYWVEDGLKIDDGGNTDSILAWIEELHVWVQVPLRFVYFLVGPLFSPELVTANGGLLPSYALSHVLFPILLLGYFGHFIRAVWSAWQVKDRRLQISILAYLVAIFVVSQVPMPIGNKVTFMPLFYVIVAYGSYQDSGSGNLLGNAGSFGLFLVQLANSLRGLV